jgi:hypothetical protein
MVLSLVGVTSASASHIAGIRATVTSEAGTDVTIDVTGYADVPYPYSTLFIGVATFFGAPIVPAVDWGDSSTIPFAGYGSATGIPIFATSTVISGLNVNAYRGSFAHTYADNSPRTITVNSTVNPGTTGSPGYNVITGNYATYVTATYSGVYAFLSNTATVFGGGPEEIPTASQYGLLALALALAGLGVFQLRRA